MNHSIVANNTECLLICQALELLKMNRKVQDEDRAIADKLQKRIRDRVKEDIAIDNAATIRANWNSRGK